VLNLALSNPSGVEVGGPAVAALRIADDDAGPPASNPVGDATFFVRQHYLDFLNREPDAPGLNFWVNQITSCATAQCREVRRISVSAAFFLSIEFQQTGLVTYLAHRAAYGVRPSYSRFVRDTQALQHNYAFDSPGAEAQLEANKRAFFSEIVAGQEFRMHFQTLMPAEDFVNLLFRSAGITPNEGQRLSVLNEFGGEFFSDNLDARARALRRVAESPTLTRNDFRAAFVLMEYFGYLRREPDTGGYLFWFDKLNEFDGDWRRAEMVRAFISSIEYRQRFGQ
jgi:Domain of unknown function (DUF4214)